METRIGIIGVGGLGYLQVSSYEDVEGVSIVGAADISADAREVFEREHGVPAYEHYRELLHELEDEMDAVTIVTPHTLHYEQAKACIERGLHVLVEKPMVTDVAHAVDLIETAADESVVLQVGYQRHFHPAFREIRRVVDEGRIGQIHMVNCYLGQDWIDVHRDSWRTNPSLSGGGQLYDSGSHLIDALLWTTDTQPVSVGAQIEFDEQGIDVNSSLSLVLEGDEGTTLASIGITGDGVDTTPSEGYVYWGTEGRITYDEDQITVAENDSVTYRTEITERMDFRTLNQRKLENFVESIEGTSEPAVPGEVGLQVTALTEAVYQAAETGSVVSVQSLIDEVYDDRD